MISLLFSRKHGWVVKGRQIILFQKIWQAGCKSTHRALISERIFAATKDWFSDQNVEWGLVIYLAKTESLLRLFVCINTEQIISDGPRSMNVMNFLHMSQDLLLTTVICELQYPLVDSRIKSSTISLEHYQINRCVSKQNNTFTPYIDLVATSELPRISVHVKWACWADPWSIVIGAIQHYVVATSDCTLYVAGRNRAGK